ncbi:hypothetical protein KI387_000792, partial [Taxus chinensis]
GNRRRLGRIGFVTDVIGVDWVRSASTEGRLANQGLCDEIRGLEYECGLLDVPKMERHWNRVTR